MALSRPLFNLTASYLQQLALHPLRTKSLTSCVIAASGNLVSQFVLGSEIINYDSVMAFGLFGLLFSGPMGHFFYKYLTKIIPSEGVRHAIFKQLLMERLLYMPIFQATSMYVISRFEGRDHNTALRNMHKILPTVITANLKYLTIFQILNLTYVPPMFRVLFVSIIGFFWTMFLAKKRQEQQKKNLKK